MWLNVQEQRLMSPAPPEAAWQVQVAPGEWLPRREPPPSPNPALPTCVRVIGNPATRRAAVAGNICDAMEIPPPPGAADDHDGWVPPRDGLLARVADEMTPRGNDGPHRYGFNDFRTATVDEADPEEIPDPGA